MDRAALLLVEGASEAPAVLVEVRGSSKHWSRPS